MITDIFPRLAGRLIPNVIHRGPTDPDDPAKYVYLTFDDGPDIDTTPHILEQLSLLNARATFFLTGEQVEKHSDIVNHITDNGHTVASHSYRHRSLMFATRKDVLEDMIRANEIIKHNTNSISPILFRPPYGRIGIAVWQAARQLGMRIVLWSLSPADYRIQPPDRIVEYIIDRVRPGDIILLHERKQTIEAIEPMIAGLRDKGLESKLL